jgi:hypothetical protein
MADKFVTVATFTLAYEAELARNLLEAEGVQAIIGGDLMGGLLPVEEIQLQVRADEAARATAILAAQAAEASLDEGWEDRAEAGVWTCSICGEPVPENVPVCYSCRTPREAIRSAAPRPTDAIQHAPDQVTPTPPPLPLPEVEELSVPQEDKKEPNKPTTVGDDLARRAFVAAVFGAAGAGVLMPLSWWFLLRLATYPGELNRTGIHHLYWALGLNAVAVVFWLGVAVYYSAVFW